MLIRLLDSQLWEIKDPWTLLAILSAIPGAYLSFRRSFIRDIKDQMIDLRNPVGVGTKTVPLGHRVLAYIFIGDELRWLELFDPTSKLNQTKAKPDKADGFRIFAWFVLTFCFSLTAWFFR